MSRGVSTSPIPLTRALRRGEFQVVPGVHYETPKELWGFRTRGSTNPATAIARTFLETNAGVLGLEPGLVGIRERRVIESLAATHVIFNQVHLGLRVHRAYVTVHLDQRGRVYLVKNRAMPKRLVPSARVAPIGEREATRRAKRALPHPERAATVVGHGEELWFPDGKRLIPSWRVRLRRRDPAEEWIVYVNARTGGIVSKYDNLAAAAAALVFDPSPVTELGNHDLVVKKVKRHEWRERRPPLEAYTEVRLKGLGRSGYLDGEHATTRPTRDRVRSTNGDFHFRSHERGFEEAMVYFHVDAAVRYLESLGYTGHRRIFDKPVAANVRGTRQDNSWYSPGSKQLTFGTGYIDDAEDGETIVHEFGHAIQDAITPDFGQSAEAAAMGEGFGDYFAGSYFADRKPRRYRNVVMTWDGLLSGLEIGADPPALRPLDSRLTYRDFRARGDEHDNGLIWSSTLWSLRKAVGQHVADTIIVESHFQLDGFTDFARGARAILDADRNCFDGAHVSRLQRVFRQRGIGPL